MGKRERELADLLSDDACGANQLHKRSRAPTINYEAGPATRRWSSATHEACWSPRKRKPKLAVRVGPEVEATLPPDPTPPPPRPALALAFTLALALAAAGRAHAAAAAPQEAAVE